MALRLSGSRSASNRVWRYALVLREGCRVEMAPRWCVPFLRLRQSLWPSVQAGVRPDASPHVTRAGGEVATGRAGNRARSHRDDGILMSLKHQLRVAGARVPELDATVLGAREDPFRVGGEGDAKNKVLYRFG